MLSINTNLSSLIAQGSMKSSTNKLNQAIERMTTGFKINHAKDNAANYAISTNMTTEMNSLMVAEDNTAMGLDMINYASDILDELNNRAQRLRDLQEQANNDTYGEDSLNAINKECNALVDEINRLYESAEYNGITLFLAPTTLADGRVVVAKESDAQLDTTFKDLGVVATHFEIFDSTDSLVQAYDLEENDTVNDFLTTLQGHGFTTNLKDGEITISSNTGLYVAGDLSDELGISTKEQSYIASTEQSYNKQIEKVSAEISTTTVWNTITTETTATETIWTTTTSSTTQTNTIWTTTTTESIQTETVTTTVRTNFLTAITVRDTSTMIALSSVDSTSQLTETYSISTSEELIKLSEMCDDGLIESSAEFVLANDINLSGVTSFRPIGGRNNNYIYFNATFDGNGFVVSNLTDPTYNVYGADGAPSTGLFGGINGAAIKNLGLEDFSFDDAEGNRMSGSYVGGLVARADNSTIENCYIINCNLTSSQSADMYIGGLVGYEYNSIITDSYDSYVTISASSATINNSYDQDYQTLLDNNELAYKEYSTAGQITTVSITTTTSVTETETIYTTATSSTTQTTTLYVTTTNSTTQTNTVWITSTVAATGGTKFEELGVNSAFKVTIVSDGTKSALTINKTTTFDEFFAQLESKGFGVSESEGKVFLAGTGDTCLQSTFLKDLLLMSSVTKTEALKTVNTKSDYQCYNEILEDVYAPGTINLMVGTSADTDSSLQVNVVFKLSDLTKFRNIGADGNDYLEQLDNLLGEISERQVQFGAVVNRLESVMDEIGIKYDNLVSSRSTIRDADIAEVSSHYIQQQILQQASATLLATANQSPSIALQLI